MPGAGTSPATTRADPPARCLDISRLVSRAGRGALTGIDRVELAYLERLLGEDTPFFALSRTQLGHVLLDRQGAAALRDRILGHVPWGAPDLLARAGRLAPARQRAEADLRRLACARARRGRLSTLLGRHVPAGTVYLNTGHSNLTEEVAAAWRALPQARITVLIHDTIPLDHPEFQRAGQPARFEAMLRRVARVADRVIYNSAATRARAEHHFAGFGRVPTGCVAHLGVDPPSPDPAALPDDLPPRRPYFVALGTIEPRKNHALLLDIWDAFAADLPEPRVPGLVIAGARGWRNEEVFRRLDKLPAGGPVREVANLSDGAVAALLAGAAALLFPSRAEGFGYPPLEAAALGVPVIAANLSATREILGDYAVYADPGDVYFWKQSIRRMAEAKQAGPDGTGQGGNAFAVPNWDSHFNQVLAFT
jgi:glycosyltransferase involved in cell wall biosynthesis